MADDGVLIPSGEGLYTPGKLTEIAGIELDGRHSLAVPQNGKGISLVGLDALAPMFVLLDLEGRRMFIAWTYARGSLSPEG